MAGGSAHIPSLKEELNKSLELRAARDIAEYSFVDGTTRPCHPIRWRPRAATRRNSSFNIFSANCTKGRVGGPFVFSSSFSAQYIVKIINFFIYLR